VLSSARGATLLRVGRQKGLEALNRPTRVTAEKTRAGARVGFIFNGLVTRPQKSRERCWRDAFPGAKFQRAALRICLDSYDDPEQRQCDSGIRQLMRQVAHDLTEEPGIHSF